MAGVKGACARTVGHWHDAQACYRYETSVLRHPPCPSTDAPRVPLIYHAASAATKPPYVVRANAAANPRYELRYLNDSSAAAYVRRACGETVYEAYRCFVAPAYRADLYRFCALYAEGGVYLDADILLTTELERVYAPCAPATLGHDFPWFGPAKQMKILAGRPNATVFGCMLRAIVRHVAHRSAGSPLALTGPALLERCYRADPARDAIALTYIDTRGGEWPYTGMRAGTEVLAYEQPSRKNFGVVDEGDYARLTAEGRVYRPSCNISYEAAPPPPPKPPPPKAGAAPPPPRAWPSPYLARPPRPPRPRPPRVRPPWRETEWDRLARTSRTASWTLTHQRYARRYATEKNVG